MRTCTCDPNNGTCQPGCERYDEPEWRRTFRNAASSVRDELLADLTNPRLDEAMAAEHLDKIIRKLAAARVEISKARPQS